MSKTKALFGLAMAMALPISIEAVAVAAAELAPPPAPPVPQVAPLEATFPLLIEAGSTQAYTDSQGRTWRADEGFIGGSVVDRGAIEISGTSDDRIYQTERWGLTGYTAKVANGKYTVRLHFAETYQDAAAKRIFSVIVEDRTIANLDVFAEAGGKNKALVKALDEVVVADGELNIDFTGAGAIVNGIEVAPALPSAPPVVTLSGGSIRENAAAGELVGTAVAKGASGEAFKYVLADDADGRFTIEGEAGAITVAAGAALDFEAAPSHDIEIAVTDAKGLTTKQRFTITVLDVSEATPPVVTLSGGSIPENAAAGELVGTAVAKGASGEVFKYALADDADGRFTIDPETGAITVAAGAVLDFEAAPSHDVEIAATDANGVTTKRRFTITVLDVSETTQGLKLTHPLAENAPAGTQVGVVAAIDPSLTKPIFSLKDDAGGRFVIDSNTGTIRVANGASLDFEAAASHSFTAVASAGAAQVAEQSFEVSLADVNEPPTVLFMSAQSVENAAAAGTVVGIASAVDPDANETFTYSLVDDAQGRFAINAATGAVSVAPNASLDYRAAPAHRIIVKATDSAGHAVTNGFTLTVRPATSTAQPMLIEAGSTADFVDAKGRTWTADAGFIGGQVADRGAIEIAGTTDDRIYQTERWGMTGYSLPVAPGLYTVKLHFAETYATAVGARVFSVDVEGQKLADLDVFAAVGSKTALVKTVPNVVVSDGKLDIAFTQKIGGAMVNAIEVEPILNCQSAAQ